MTWTWDTLTRADRGTLRELMKTGDTPDPARIQDHTFAGLNRGLIPKLTGERFHETINALRAETWLAKSDLGYFVLLSSQEHANLIKHAGPRFEAAGLATKWLVGDTALPERQVLKPPLVIRYFFGPSLSMRSP